MSTFTIAAASAANFVLAQSPGETPVGPDFGKASPIGLLLLVVLVIVCLLYTSPSPRDLSTSRMPSSA